MLKLKRYQLCLIAIVILLICAAWIGAKQTKPKQTWEYKVVQFSDSTGKPPSEAEKMLNEQGAEGWELVGTETVHNLRMVDYYFKRAK